MLSKIIYREEGTHCPYTSFEFANQTAEEIVAALSEYREAAMQINVYTPPYAEDDFPDGFIRLIFFKENLKTAQIGLEFGQTDENDLVAHYEFDRRAWENTPDDPHSSGINAVKFDEAWRIICLVARDLKILHISISYGY